MEKPIILKSMYLPETRHVRFDYVHDGFFITIVSHKEEKTKWLGKGLTTQLYDWLFDKNSKALKFDEMDGYRFEFEKQTGTRLYISCKDYDNNQHDCTIDKDEVNRLREYLESYYDADKL